MGTHTNNTDVEPSSGIIARLFPCLRSMFVKAKLQDLYNLDLYKLFPDPCSKHNYIIEEANATFSFPPTKVADSSGDVYAPQKDSVSNIER